MAYVRPKGKGYEIRVSNGRDINGRQIEASITWAPEPGMTPKQIEKALEREKVLFEQKVKSGQYLDGKVKLADFAEKWLRDYVVANCKKTVVNRYEMLMIRVVEALGHKRLEDIQPHHLLEFYKNLEEPGVRDDIKYKPLISFRDLLKEKKLTQTKVAKTAGVSVAVLKSCIAGKNITADSAKKVAEALEMDFKKLFTPVDADKRLAPNTILYYHRLLSSMFSTAVKWQIIFSNPCSRVDAPKGERKEAKYLDEVEAARLLKLLENEPIQFRTMVKLLLYTSIRRAELCGLEWTDFDFDNRTVRIQRNSLYLPGEGIFEDSTKTVVSDRVIKISAVTVEVLKSYRSWQEAEAKRLRDRWHNSGRLFTTWDGKPIHPDTVTGWFSDFAKKHGFDGIHPHSLRHTGATLLIAAGTPLPTVQKRLGHAALTTTANIYAHAVKSADAVAADVLEDILNPKKAKAARKKA